MEPTSPRRARVVTISGLRLEVTRFGELKIGHRILDPDEGDRVAETITALTKEAYRIKHDLRKPRSERGL